MAMSGHRCKYSSGRFSSQVILIQLLGASKNGNKKEVLHTCQLDAFCDDFPSMRLLPF